jgi:hypothetical protein
MSNLAALFIMSAAIAGGNTSMDRIRPFEKNPSYWQYKGKGVLLLGGSVEDNLFQIPRLAEHLDLLKSVGGNYVRCTMSSRDEGDVWPFEKDAATGKYDLTRPGAEYWKRFETFLKLTAERDIIVQIEVWATFDFYRSETCWAANPFNPANNVNYTPEDSRLPVKVDSHPTKCENPFFRTVPAEDDNGVVLKYQQAFVDKLLSISLPYGNVLYCMDNETSVTPEWGWYWSKYITAAARKAGVEVHTTEMWDKWDLAHPQHNATFDHPELYSFVDVSQNNHQQGQTHWDNALKQLKRVAASGKVRPLNCVKTYGADTGRFGNDRDGQERFWRSIFVGIAAARFHRPDSGLGLNDKAQANIRGMRMLAGEIDVLAAGPANELLDMRSPNEAYCMAVPGEAYAVYFTDGGQVTLDVSAVGDKPVTLKWLDVAAGKWSQPRKTAVEDGKVSLKTPGEGFWAVVVTPSR